MKDSDISKLLPDWTLTYVLSETDEEKIFQAEKETASQTKYSLVRAFYIPNIDEKPKDTQNSDSDEEELRRFTFEKLAKCKKEFTFFRSLSGKSGWLNLRESYDISDVNGLNALSVARFDAAQRLSDFIDENGFTQGAVLKMGIDLCRGLEHLKKEEKLHGSLCPDIIFVDENCRFRIGKINLDVSESRKPDTSSTETLAFTAPYARTGGLSYSSDTYSVGLIMYYFLNGKKLPFENDMTREEAINRRLSGEKIPKPLYDAERITNIVLKACSEEKKNGYQTPYQMRKDLEEAYVRLQKEIEEKKIKERTEQKEDKSNGASGGTDISAFREHKKSDDELNEEKRRKGKRNILLMFTAFAAVLVALWVFVPQLINKIDRNIGNHKIHLASVYYKDTEREEEFSFSYEYDGKAKEPKIVIDGLENLVEGNDYTVSYENNIEVGEALIKVTGVGKYSGEKIRTFEIKPKKAEKPGVIESFTASDITSDSVRLSWGKSENADRYVIYMFKEEQNEWGKRDFEVDSSQTSMVLTGLKPDKEYSFRVRGINISEDGKEKKSDSTEVKFKTKP